MTIIIPEEETTLVELRRRAYEKALQELINQARTDGYVLYTEQLIPPGFTLAMGNYVMVGKARLAKELYR